MIKTGIKKEFMLLTRSGKLFALIAVLIATALFDPLVMKMMQSMMEIMPELYENMGSADETVDAIKSMSLLIGDFTPASIAAQCTTELSGLGAVVLLFIFMSAAGGEQKKRSVMIPRCAGLTPAMYAAPKFIIFTSLVFVFSFVSMLAGAGISMLLFEGSVDLSLVVLSALSLAFYMSFLTVLQLTIGLCTGAPGVAVVSVIAASYFVPIILASFGIDRFNPFALQTLATSTALLSGGAEASGTGLGSVLEQSVKGTTFDSFNFAVSLIVTVIIGVMLYLATVFSLSAKRVDNRGDEPLL